MSLSLQPSRQYFIPSKKLCFVTSISFLASSLTSPTVKVLAISPTKELDTIAYDTILSLGAKPAFLNYNGFKGSICASPNDVIVHGIPNKKVVLKDGDIISIDIGAVYKGFVGDMLIC